MHAPADPANPPDCCAVVRRDGRPRHATSATRRTFPADRLRGETDPFRLLIEDAELSDRGTAGGFGDVRWELRWDPGRTGPGCRSTRSSSAARLARTMYVIPQPRLAIEGTVTFAGRELELDGRIRRAGAPLGRAPREPLGLGARGGPRDAHGRARDRGLDRRISITAPRFGREVGPNTSVVGRLLGEHFSATNPVSVVRARAELGPERYRAETASGTRRVVLEVVAVPRRADRRALRRSRRRAPALLEQRDRRPALPGLGPRRPRARRLDPARDAARTRPRVLRVRPARTARPASRSTSVARERPRHSPAGPVHRGRRADPRRAARRLRAVHDGRRRGPHTARHRPAAGSRRSAGIVPGAGRRIARSTRAPYGVIAGTGGPRPFSGEYDGQATARTDRRRASCASPTACRSR